MMVRSRGIVTGRDAAIVCRLACSVHVSSSKQYRPF